jgi:LL-diaminopimelate aminotransferase
MIIAPAHRLEAVGEYYFSTKLDAIRKMNAQGADVINLGIGNPDMAPSPETVETAIQALKNEKNHGYQSYRSIPELKKAIADWYERSYGVSLDSNTQVLPLLGSKEGIMYVSMAFLNPGDGVLVPNPGYPAYRNVANLLGARIVDYDLSDKTDWLPDLNSLQKQDLTNIKLMWVNYPNMPTGRNGSRELFKDLVSFAKANKILVVNDNPYSHVLNDDPISILEQDPSLEYTMELNSLSKGFNMAGWRVGMLLGQQAYIDATVQVKSNVDTGMFLPLQLASVRALENSSEWHHKRNEIYAERRRHVFEMFDLLDFEYRTDQVGLFVWAKAPEKIGDVPAYLENLLQEAKVFLVPGSVFGTTGARYARSSLCATKETLQKAVERVRTWKIGKK